MASDSLLHWWRAREHLCGDLPEFSVCEPPWKHDTTFGLWLFAPTRAPPRNTPHVSGFHGTSMHVLTRAMTQGLENGWSGLERHGKLHVGVYYHKQERAQYCANYMTYSALDNSGFVFGPMIQLRAPETDPDSRTTTLRTSGLTQNLTYQDCAAITGIWLHALHVADVLSRGADTYIWAEARFAQELELDPGYSRQELIWRSSQNSGGQQYE
jgi:hypothetical protein